MSGIRVTVLIEIMLQLMVAAQATGHVLLPPIQKRSLAYGVETETGVLPPGFVAFPEYRLAYKYFGSNVTHDDAIVRCLVESAQLAVIDSSEKVDKILSYFSSLESAWVGLIHPYQTEKWTTMTGKSRNNLPWASGEPNGNGRCAFVARSYNGLRTDECQVKYPYLCELYMELQWAPWRVAAMSRTDAAP